VCDKDSIGYLNFILHLQKTRRYDALFPANEQAYLFAWAKDMLTPLTGLAVADFSAFNRVQTKSAFMRLLDELGMPHPETRYARTWPEIEQAAGAFPPPFFLKTSYGTASIGVWRIARREALAEMRAQLEAQKLLNGEVEFLVQAAARGFSSRRTPFLIMGSCSRSVVPAAW